ncbi:MAG: MATE family efflux transporter [Bacillota bacterium]|nr:MATE family efflux transporter [Bacillota bacterium]
MGNLITGEITPKNFTKFVWPSVLMMVIIGLYYGMDSVFVANLVGEDALAGLAIAYPIQGVMWGFAVMLASGSSAIVAIKMGEGKNEEADRKFTLVCVLSVILGCIFTVGCLIFMSPLVQFLGATELLSHYCHDFLEILVWGFPAAFLGVLFEYFIRVDGRPGFTLILYISGGVVHLALDYILMGPLQMGIRGAAYANIGGLVAVMVAGGAYFIFMKTRLSFRRFKNDWRFIGHCFVNGSSEMVSEASAGITTFFFNMVVIRIVGEVGVAAVSIILNIHYLLISVHLGYVMGVAPLISYYYGAKEYDKVNTFIRYSKNFILVTSIVSAIGCLLFGQYIVMVFERPGSELFELAVTGTRFLAIALLLCGANIFASGFFTAYGNGQISALISMSRALIMVIIGMLVLGWLFGMTGIWLTLAFAEVATLALTFGMFNKYKDVYHYRLL